MLIVFNCFSLKSIVLILLTFKAKIFQSCKILAPLFRNEVELLQHIAWMLQDTVIGRNAMQLFQKESVSLQDTGNDFSI